MIGPLRLKWAGPIIGLGLDYAALPVWFGLPRLPLLAAAGAFLLMRQFMVLVYVSAYVLVKQNRA